LSIQRPRPSIEMRMPAAASMPVNSPLVNWLPPAFAGAGLYGAGSVKRDFSIRGELAAAHANARYTLVFGRSGRTSTMMQ
jgi:hypothetical protein